MTIHHPSVPLPHQGPDVAVAQAGSHALGVAQCRVSRRCFDGAQVTAVGRKDVYYALAVLTVVNRRYDQAISKHIPLIRHLATPFLALQYPASSVASIDVPKAGVLRPWGQGKNFGSFISTAALRTNIVLRALGTRRLSAVSVMWLVASKAFAFNEIQSQLVRRAQGARFRLKNNTSDIAARTVVDRNLFDAHSVSADDGADRVIPALEGKTLFHVSSNLCLIHSHDSVRGGVLILQGADRQSKHHARSNSAPTTLATVKPPRDRRTRLRPDTEHKDCSHG